jgi:cell division septation protein DedD
MSLARAGVILLSVFMLAAASGCSHEQRDWHSAQAANTIEAYEQFITEHPKSARATDAQALVVQLTDARDWQRASTTDTADAYRQFLLQHPQSKTASEARIRIENFGLSASASPAPAAALAPGPAAAPPAPAPEAKAPRAARPAPRPHPAEPVPSSEGGPYSVQLGAFASETKAQNQWRRLNARYAALLQGAIADIERGQGRGGRRLYRLKAKGLTEARARQICAAFKKHSQGCVLVRPDKR